MKNLIAYRKTDLWKNILMFLFSLTFMIVWLPFIRSIFDGESYVWGTEYFGFWLRGEGVTPEFLFLIIQLVFYVGLFYSMYWVKNRNIFYSLLVVWWVNFFGNLLFDILKNGDTVFHGDTLNVHVSISAIVIPLSVIALFVIFMAIKSDMNAIEKHIEWKSKNSILLAIILGPLVVQAVLLATGEPHGVTDQIGVILALIQCFTIPFIYRPYQNSEVKSPVMN
ncbi:ubiquinol cytochrome C oxidoreductase [Marinigracilibium pacificum]|uniref:Ubiquinol cytochrome C oxidoreductase n=1 Tax=Marinigracilibium pacificum TaxID=2729599 RepID=A0A848IZD5_9BACT|nr:ubiquinol cytochrome C oxidoreductase [Marinigracilibium pacificum]NMM47584.1 ubiquinol cytochrome C oxidoreductase [Marinigracilibium pacificum]